jgi:hypothetical protein
MTIKINTKEDQYKASEEYRLRQIVSDKFDAKETTTGTWYFWPKSKSKFPVFTDMFIKICARRPTKDSSICIYSTPNMMRYAQELAQLFDAHDPDKSIMVTEM